MCRETWYADPLIRRTTTVSSDLSCTTILFTSELLIFLFGQRVPFSTDKCAAMRWCGKHIVVFFAFSWVSGGILDFILQVVIVDQVKGKLAAKTLDYGHCFAVKDQGDCFCFRRINMTGEIEKP